MAFMHVQNKDTGATAMMGYTNVVVANGHHWDAAWPELRGTFSGTLMHSHEYRTAKPMEGKRVLVIGAGNSGELHSPWRLVFPTQHNTRPPHLSDNSDSEYDSAMSVCRQHAEKCGLTAAWGWAAQAWT
jgi:hypothetical protein